LRRLSALADPLLPFGEKELCSLEKCIRKALRLLEVSPAESSKVEFCEFEDFAFMADSDCIAGAFAELIANSLEAVSTVDRPQVQIKTLLDGATGVLSVQDNGAWERTEMLREVKETSTTLPLRPRLGLTICDWFFRSYGGHLAFEPLASGGMRATVRLPRLIS
jgi:C4-dicarboxylate-specific signal transduction histidine kinase